MLAGGLAETYAEGQPMGNGADDRLAMRSREAEARARGYEDEACGECGNFTLVRNGTSLKCDTCGTKTGEHCGTDQKPDLYMIWFAVDWLYFLSRCPPWQAEQHMYALETERNLMAAVQLDLSYDARRAFQLGIRGLFRLGFITSIAVEVLVDHHCSVSRYSNPER